MDKERIYTASFTMQPAVTASTYIMQSKGKKPKIKNRGKDSSVLAIVAEDLDENLYNHVKANINSVTHKGKVELGVTGTDGIRIQMAFNSATALNEGIDTLLDLANSVIEDGVQDDSLINPKPRKDLLKAFNNRVLIYDKLVPRVYNMHKFNQVDAINAFDTNNPYYKLLESTRLIPSGYQAQWR